MSDVKPSLRRCSAGWLAELLGTGLLVTVVVGSGIAAASLSPTDVGLQLLENSLATVLGLAVLILVFGPVSGAHFNPVVSVVDWLLGRRRGTGLSAREVVGVRVRPGRRRHLGCGAGERDVRPARRPDRDHRPGQRGPRHRGGRRHGRAGAADLRPGPDRPGGPVRGAVGAYIGAAYWFTSSTSFANPAVTVGRMFSDTFAGIAPGSVPLFVVAQLVGAGVGLALVQLLFPDASAAAGRAVVPHANAVTTTEKG